MTLFSILLRVAKNIAHLGLAILAVLYYGNPSRNLKIIGITGTDGKTTTSYYAYQLLELAGKKAALISTVGVFMNGKKSPLGFHVTTPSPFSLNKYLKLAANYGVEYVVLEVSSHAIDQHRIYGIKPEIGTITNVTKEHLDYHRSIENYLNTKIKLLKLSKNVVLNISDPFFDVISKKIGDKNIKTYSLEGKDADLTYYEIKNDYTESLTDYNKKNLMTAVLALKILGIELSQITSKVRSLKLPEGRLQYLKKLPFEVIIDFAHTPNAFYSLLPEIRKKTKGRLIHVFGSAGKRDRLKRPDMGKISSEYSDIIILTTEDPRGENLHSINSDIRKGISKDFVLISNVELSGEKISNKSVVQIDDREQAIKFATKIAKSGDCVVITGKGPENSMNIGNKEIEWSDIEVTKKIIS